MVTQRERTPHGALRVIVSRLARNRLAQFLAVGACIFAVAPSPARDRAIHLSSRELAARRAEQASRLGVRELSAAEAGEVEARMIEDALLVREARELALDRSDLIIEQRLVQKLLFLNEDLRGASREPNEAELRAFFDATRERWRRPARLRLVHVFATTSDAAARLRPEVVAWSQTAPSLDAVPPMGASLPVSRSLAASPQELGAIYGDTFSKAVAALAVGEWSGPIASRYGHHLVRVVEHEPERPASFEESRRELVLSYLVTRREEASVALKRELFERYRVYLDDQAVERFEPTRRVAARADPSRED